MSRDFSEKVYRVVRKIPPGKVMTYGQIAVKLGQPKAARAVGNALHHNPDSKTIPCHRVVNRKGGLAPNFGFGGWPANAIKGSGPTARSRKAQAPRDFAGWREHKRRLLKEGVKFRDEKHVDLKRHLLK